MYDSDAICLCLSHKWLRCVCFNCHSFMSVTQMVNMCTIQLSFVYVFNKLLICVRFKWHLIISVTTIFNRCKLQLAICYAFYNTIQPLFASWAIRVYRSQTDLSFVRFSCHLIVFVTKTCNLCSFLMSFYLICHNKC